MSILFAQQEQHFSATGVMPEDSFEPISISDGRDKLVVPFFCPPDFTSSLANGPAPASGL